MSAKQFHEMSTDELQLKLKDLKSELFNLRFQNAMGQGQLANPLAINLCKKNIARALTILRERELKAAQAKELK